MRIPFMLVFLSTIAFGQLASNTVTVTATQNLTPQPDQVVFEVVVSSDLATTLSTVLNAVQPAGLTLANFSGVSSASTTATAPSNPTTLNWAFTLPAPLTGAASTISSLTSLAASAPQANKNLSVQFSIVGTQVSPQLQQSQSCDPAGLINQARTQAQNLASAGGRTLGGILAISGAAPTTPAAAYYAIGSFVSLTSGTQTCSLTATFSLLGI